MRRQHCPNPFLKRYSGYDVKNRLERAYDRSRVPSSGQGRDGEPEQCATTKKYTGQIYIWEVEMIGLANGLQREGKSRSNLEKKK